MHIRDRLVLALMAVCLAAASCGDNHVPGPKGILLVPGEFGTIQAAIDAAADGDTVVVAPGDYVGEGNRDIDFKGKAIVVRSEGGPDETLIACAGAEGSPRRGFYFGSGERSDTRLEGFTITDGYVAGDREVGIGGAIVCTDHSSPTIAECEIIGNYAGSNGGGIFCSERSSPDIIHCRLEANTAGKEGGGIYCNDSDPEITGSVIADNHAGMHGGGIFGSNADITVRSSVISDNEIGIGDGGGACFWDGSHPRMTNCVICGNVSEALGGGVFFAESPAILTNCTIADNAAAVVGGGLYCRKNSDPSVANCILWGNLPEQIHVHVDDISVMYSDVERAWTGLGNISADPRFVGDGDYHLLPESPCIDAGIDVGVHDDMDGEGRPWDHPGRENIYGAYDMGAYEYRE